MLLPKIKKKKKLNKTEENKINNAELFEFFSSKGIYSCELMLEGCEGAFNPQYAHSKKRNRMAKSGEERVKDMKEVCLACGHCHNKIEYAEGTESETGHQIMARLVREAIARRE